MITATDGKARREGSGASAARRSGRGRRRAVATGGAAAIAAAIASLGASAPARGSGGAYSAADGAGTVVSANLTQFAVDSPVMIHAELIAVEYWNESPCAGVAVISWASLSPTINAISDWWNPVSEWGNSTANSLCRITLNQDKAFDWPMFCTMMVHEVGHLLGLQHSPDPGSVMYPIYVGPIAECTGTPDGGPPEPAPPPTPAPVDAAAAVAAPVATVAHRHRRHKHRRHHRVRKHHRVA